MGKVIFSQACVKNSVHGGVPGPGGSAPRGVCSGGACSGGSLLLGGACSGGEPAPGRVPGGDPTGRLLLRAVRILLECILVLN